MKGTIGLPSVESGVQQFDFFVPKLTNPLKFSFDAAASQVKLCGDLPILVSLHLPQRDLSQRIIIKQLHQALVLIGQQSEEFGCWRLAHQFVESLAGSSKPVVVEHRITPHLAATSLLPHGGTPVVDDLVSRHRHQQTPQLVAIGNLGEPTTDRAAAKAPKHAQRHVLLVNNTARRLTQPLARHTYQPLEIPLPKPLGRVFVSVGKLAQVMRNRVIVRHAGSASEPRFGANCVARFERDSVPDQDKSPNDNSG